MKTPTLVTAVMLALVAETTTTRGLAQCTASWSQLGGTFDLFLTDAAAMPNGDIVVSGEFASVGGTPIDYVARWNGTGWSPLGPGLVTDHPPLLPMSNGDLIVGGTIPLPGGGFGNPVRWSGTSWSAVGPAVITIWGRFYCLTLMPNGDLVAGGEWSLPGGGFGNLARWDGVTWSNLGPPVSGGIGQIRALPNGDLVVSGGPPLQFMRWNGTAWSNLGIAPSAWEVMANGDLVATVPASTGGSTLLRWNGAAWTPLGSLPGGASSMASLPNGDLVVATRLVTTSTTVDMTRWDGATWHPLQPLTASNSVRLVSLPDGVVALANHFTSGVGFSCYAAKLTTSCAPIATTFAAGCASSGGSNTLTATSMPWVDATLRTRGSGLPNLAVVLTVTSFASIPQGTAPLASFFGSTSPAGCDLLVGPDIVQAFVTTNGVVDASLFVPSSPAIVGVPFFQQMIPVEVNSALDVLAITATNSLRLVPGDF